MQERTPRAYRPSLTVYDYTWDSDRRDAFGRDPVEVERRIQGYEVVFKDLPPEIETTEEEDEGLCEMLEMDWCGTVGQLREEGLESVLCGVRQGNHLESPF